MKFSFARVNNINFFVALAAIIFLIYANGLNTSFQSDDERHLDTASKRPVASYFIGLASIGYRYINNVSFSLNYQWAQENPFSYHLFNILIHTCSTFLVFIIARLTIAKSTGWGESAAQKIALITALLFGLHPIQTETVTYISGRPGGLAGLFYFSSLLFFILGGLKKSQGKTPGFIFNILSLLSFFCAMLSKETAITLPVILLLYDLCLMKGENWKTFRSRLGFYILFPVLAFLAFLKSPAAFVAIGSLLKKIHLSLLWVQLDILKHPLKLFLFPFNLTFEYDFKTQVMWDSLIVSLALLVVVLFLTIKKFYLKTAILSFSTLWFLITVAPTNSVMPRTHLFSERNLYIPYFGLSLFFAVILYLIFFKENRCKFLWGISFLLAIGISFSSLVVKRNQAYVSPSTLWADTFEKTPKKLSVGKTLSIHYLMEEKYPEALKTLNALLKINPGLYDVHQNMGLAYKHLGDMKNAEKKFKDAIQVNFNKPEAHYNLASLYGNQGRAIEASDEFDISAKLWLLHSPPQNFYSDKARAHNSAGIAYIQTKNYEEALKQLEKAVRQNPNLMEARFNLAKLLLEFKKDKAKAAIHLQAALKLNPNPQQTQVLQSLLSQTE